MAPPCAASRIPRSPAGSAGGRRLAQHRHAGSLSIAVAATSSAKAGSPAVRQPECAALSVPSRPVRSPIKSASVSGVRRAFDSIGAEPRTGVESRSAATPRSGSPCGAPRRGQPHAAAVRWRSAYRPDHSIERPRSSGPQRQRRLVRGVPIERTPPVHTTSRISITSADMRPGMLVLEPVRLIRGAVMLLHPPPIRESSTPARSTRAIRPCHGDRQAEAAMAGRAAIACVSDSR
jgi:hypothetical protein